MGVPGGSAAHGLGWGHEVQNLVHFLQHRSFQPPILVLIHPEADLHGFSPVWNAVIILLAFRRRSFSEVTNYNYRMTICVFMSWMVGEVTTRRFFINPPESKQVTSIK